MLPVWRGIIVREAKQRTVCPEPQRGGSETLFSVKILSRYVAGPLLLPETCALIMRTPPARVTPLLPELAAGQTGGATTQTL